VNAAEALNESKAGVVLKYRLRNTVRTDRNERQTEHNRVYFFFFFL
jgi:hypothetical protein